MENNKQENFWLSDFAKGYIKRNNIDDQISNIPSRVKMFYDILSKTDNVQSALELGSNIGLNLRSLRNIKPNIKLSAVEINKEACEILKEIDNIDIVNKSILDLEKNDINKYDFSFTSGVLIHIKPEYLNKVYEILYDSSNKYIMIAEYYNTEPTMIPYHGENDVLFKRDFAGEMLNKYSDLKLIDYGFVYRRDPNFPLGDITWFLMEK